MIPFLIGLSLVAPITITQDLKEAYLYQNPVVVTFHNQNTTEQTLIVPDLSVQTWRTSFVLTKKGKKEIRRNEKKKDTPTWTLPPNGIRILRLEIPSGNTLPRGEYTSWQCISTGYFQA